MDIFKRKQDPESPEALLSTRERTVRRYTYNEVASIMAMLSGVAFDGQIIREWEYQDSAHWVRVEVTFFNDEYEYWYFFKDTDEETQA